MLASCTVCHREYVASQKGGHDFICSRCQNQPKKSRLGLHPALERKWAYEKNPTTQIIADRHTRVPHDMATKHAGLSDSSTLPKIPGFDISFAIGRGAMGSVYRARQIKTGRSVAIKILSHDLSERADLVARFEREAYALKALSHPNIVTVIDAGHVGTIHYFAMEFIDGITLRTRINRGTIGFVEAGFITEQILAGLKEAHLHGIIHRDLKPENVLLAYDNGDFLKKPSRVVLVDFGLVGIGGVAFDPHPNLTRSRVTMGTVNYMAPEQHIDAKRVDNRSDLYSLGVMFFEMLTGELPLGRYLLPHERGMEVSAEVDRMLSTALSRNLETRYASADDFLADLKQAMTQHQTEIDLSNPHHVPLTPKIKQLVKLSVYKSRYALLILVAGIFFALGIKLSLASLHANTDHKTEQSIKAKK